MNTLEFPYKSFFFEQSRIGPVDKVKQYFFEKKNDIIQYFKDIFNIEQVVEYGLSNMQYFEPIIIRKDNKEKILLRHTNVLHPALELFEAVINMMGLPEDDIMRFKKYHFSLVENQYVYLKDIQIIEGELINSVLIEEFNKSNDKAHSDSFRKISEYVQKGLIICRKAIDVLDKTHYDTLLNPKMAIDQQTELEIYNALNNVEITIKS